MTEGKGNGDGGDAPRKVDRRTLLRVGGKVTFGTVVALAVFRGPVWRALAGVLWPAPDYQTLPDACLEAATTDERVIAALIDTIVPGSESDPTGAPGALDCCAMNLVFDEFFPFLDMLPLVVMLLDTSADDLYGKPFIECDLEERTEALWAAEDAMPYIRLAYKYIRSAFYAGSYNLKGTNYLGWPGPNTGYFDHPDFSFWEPVSDEQTEDGNLP